MFGGNEAAVSGQIGSLVKEVGWRLAAVVERSRAGELVLMTGWGKYRGARMEGEELGGGRKNSARQQQAGFKQQQGEYELEEGNVVEGMRQEV